MIAFRNLQNLAYTNFYESDFQVFPEDNLFQLEPKWSLRLIWNWDSSILQKIKALDFCWIITSQFLPEI